MSDRDLVHHTVRNMLQGKDLTDSQMTSLANKGWLCTASNGEPALHPMVLRAWATMEGGGDDTSYLPVVLSKMFRFDINAALGFEANAEKVFMYFEQARRLSFPHNTTTTLADHYPGGSFHKLNGITEDTFLRVRKKKIIKVKNFNTAEACRDTLRRGSIVVSEMQNEPGVECIFPFHARGTVFCGGVQVKFRDKVPSDVEKKIFSNPAMKQLGEDSKFKCFGILFSTQQGTAKRFTNVCSFNAEGLMKLMEPKVGPLRVLYDKRIQSATSSVLASRPVWPATLSQSPTRTSAIRWVPFLRSICKHI